MLSSVTSKSFPWVFSHGRKSVFFLFLPIHQGMSVDAREETEMKYVIKTGRPILTSVVMCSLPLARGSIRGWRLADFCSSHSPDVAKSIHNEWPSSQSDLASRTPRSKQQITQKRFHK